MNENEELTYPIPANVISNYEFIPGLGWHELIIILVIGVIGGVCVFILQGLIPYLIGALFMLAVIVATIILSKFDGFLTSISVAATIIVLILALLNLPIYINVFVFLGPVIFTFNYVKRDPIQGFSMYVHGRTKREYKRSQKTYYYKREVKFK